MHEVVTNNLERITELCRKHGVLRLELLGSAACGDFDEQRSEVDFLIEFFPYEFQGFEDKYFVMIRELRTLLGRDVDLVEDGCVRNPYVRASIDRTKVPVYTAAA